MSYPQLADVSHWQGVVDWSKYRYAYPPLGAVILKASQGDSTSPYARDSKFVLNKTNCIQLQIPWGAYHFFDPRYDSITQADWFVSVVGAGCSVYVADIETNKKTFDPNNPSVFTPAEMMSKVKKFVERVKLKTGKMPVIYTSYGLWNTYSAGVTVWWSNYPLWVAHYTTADNPILPRGWTTWKVWQYTSKGDGPLYGMESLGLDMNYYNGTEEGMIEWFGNGTLPENAPPPTLPEYVTVNASTLNIRRGAGTVHQDIGNTYYGNELDVIGMEQDSSGQIWYKCQVFVSGKNVIPHGEQVAPIVAEQNMMLVRIHCTHCGSKFIEDQYGNCSACGAPNKA